MVMTPYTEWYWNALRVPGSPTARFHAEHYGDRPYADFRPPFAEGLRAWDPSAWARLFRRACARYVVLVTKHHDGYCLWPSGVANPHQAGWCSDGTSSESWRPRCAPKACASACTTPAGSRQRNPPQHRSVPPMSDNAYKRLDVAAELLN
jgi:hypothetical protein